MSLFDLQSLACKNASVFVFDIQHSMWLLYCKFICIYFLVSVRILLRITVELNSFLSICLMLLSNF